MRFLPILLAALVVTATPAVAQDTPPPTATDPLTDPAFEPLEREFGHLFKSLQNNHGLRKDDRPVLESFRDRVTAFNRAHPDHVRGVAMALQLAIWLDEKQAVADLWQQLMRLRPEDPTVGRAWLQHLESLEDADPEELLEGYERMSLRFPDDEDLLSGWMKRLKQEMRYGEIIDILRSGGRDLTAMPGVMLTLADCLFATHQFEEALELFEQIPETGDPRVKAEIQRQRQYFEEGPALWQAEQALRASEASADDLPRVEIQTAKGRVVVELLENEAPNTVANFVSLVESGFYVQTKFHRFEPDFMIQGGDPFTKPGETGTPGTGDPGYKIPDEHTLAGHRNHFNDSVAMAKTTAPNTAGCQFYFTHRPTPWLNGKHTVFGRVIEGRDVVLALRKDDEITGARVLRKRDHEYQPTTIPTEG